MPHEPPEPLPDDHAEPQPSDETRIVPCSIDPAKNPALAERVALRMMSQLAFLESGFPSGTLQKAHRLGAGVRQHYLHDRTCFEFGHGWEILPVTRVLWGRLLSEPDEPAITETCWHATRYNALRIFPEDRVLTRYIRIDADKPVARQGSGLVMTQTSASWVPKGHLLLALIAEYDARAGAWREPRNPFLAALPRSP